MRRELHPERSPERCRPRSFSHPCRRDWLARQPGRVQTRCADRRRELTRTTLRAQKRGGSFFSWQYDGGEKGDGECDYEDDQIYKSAKKEFKNTEEPALAVNVAD